MSELEHLRDEIKEYHRSFGWEVGENLDESDFSVRDENAAGFWILSEGQPYLYVIGWETEPFRICFSYDMAGEIASRLDEETARKYADPIEGVDDTSIEEWASINVLDDVSKEDSNDIDYRLRDIISSFPVWHMTKYTRQDRVKGFRVHQYIFPEEERFTRSTYMEKISETLTVGQRAQWFLEYTYNLGFGQHGEFGIDREAETQIP